MNQREKNSKTIRNLDKSLLVIGIGLLGLGVLQCWFIFANRDLADFKLGEHTHLTPQLYENVYKLLRDLMFGVMPGIAVGYFFSGSVILYCLRKRSILEQGECENIKPPT